MTSENDPYGIELYYMYLCMYVYVSGLSLRLNTLLLKMVFH